VQLPALHLLLTWADPAGGRRRRTRRGADVRPQTTPEEAIGYLRERGITLAWDQAAGSLQAGTAEAAQDHYRESKLTGAEKLPYRKEEVKRTPVARRWREPAPG